MRQHRGNDKRRGTDVHDVRKYEAWTLTGAYIRRRDRVLQNRNDRAQYLFAKLATWLRVVRIADYKPRR